MSQEPKFSVVIPAYNRLSFLKQTLNSVWTQTFGDYEVIVVDDGSTDGTADWLAGQRVRVIRQANRGPGAARNVGARAARGIYVALLDSDDLWLPWTLDVFAWAIQEYGDPNIVAGKWLEFVDEMELRNIRKESYAAASFVDYLSSSHHPFSVGSGTCVLRREALVATKFLEDRLNAEDHDLILRMGTFPGFVQIVAPVTVAWRRHVASETADFVGSFTGAMRLLERERSGVYPGGHERSQERRRIISGHTLPIALACVRKGELKQGWKHYRSTFLWNIKLGRWKYVLGFPMVAAFSRYLSLFKSAGNR